MAVVTLVTPETKATTTTLQKQKQKQKQKQSHSSKHKHKDDKKQHSNPNQPNPKPNSLHKQKQKSKSSSSSSSSSSWDQIKNLLTCKQIEGSQVHDPAAKPKLASSCGSLCSVRDVVHGNTRVVHRADDTNNNNNNNNSPETSSVSRGKSSAVTRSSGRSNGGGCYTSASSRGMQFRKLSGCYECHMIVDPSRYPIQPRSTICSCPQCGEVFPKIESLELHQAVRHAVSELGPEDSGRNIVEIIFKSSWLKKDNPIFKIERILKVHVTQRTIQRFEDCRDAVKSRAKKNPRCAADGNELLRFHCATLGCSLGSRASTSLCSTAACGVCATIRHGFSAGAAVTTASSGRAHDALTAPDYFSRRAMIVCRVIAGRVRRGGDGEDDDDDLGGASGYDSAAACGPGGIYGNLEEITVFNPRAILPCFVVIYRAIGSS